MKIASNCVVDEAFFLVRLVSGLILENGVVVPPLLDCEGLCVSVIANKRISGQNRLFHLECCRFRFFSLPPLFFGCPNTGKMKRLTVRP